MVAKAIDGSTISLPRSAVTQKFAYIGKSGAGKTYATGKMIEEFYDANAQIIIVDPVGNWSGIRVTGTGPGLEIPVMGGLHGDLPLYPESGEAVANYLAKWKMSAILDVSQFTRKEQQKFVEAFARQFLHAKKSHVSPVMIIWEECQFFVPQKSTNADLLEAVELLVKVGRNYGVGTTLLGQRPQSINKDVLNLTECFICFQLTAPHERKAVAEWMSYADVVTKELEYLPTLEPGEAFIWSPSWLKLKTRVKFLKKRTDDFSKTPDFEEYVASVKSIAPIRPDVTPLLAELKKVVENSQGDIIERGAAKLKIAELTRKLDEARQEIAELRERESTPAVRTVYQPVYSRADAARMEYLARCLADVVNMGDQYAELVAKANDSCKLLPEKNSNDEAEGVHSYAKDDVKVTAKALVALTPDVTPERASVQESPKNSDLHGGEYKIVYAAAAVYPEECSLEYLAVVSGFVLAGGFRNYVGNLKKMGYLEKSGTSASYRATKKARDSYSLRPKKKLPKEILEIWMDGKLKGKGKIKHILRAYYEANGKTIPLAEMANMVGMTFTGGFRNYIGKLKNLNLITKGIGGYRLSDILIRK